jgi:hypothetical protein
MDKARPSPTLEQADALLRGLDVDEYADHGGFDRRVSIVPSLAVEDEAYCGDSLPANWFSWKK